MARIVEWIEGVDEFGRWGLAAIVDDGDPDGELRTVGGYINDWASLSPRLQAAVAAGVRRRIEERIPGAAAPTAPPIRGPRRSSRRAAPPSSTRPRPPWR